MEGYAFSMELSVRDYECDLQGVVGNSVYQDYLTYVRHEYLRNIGVDFKEYAEKGINLVVVRVEIDYKASLTSSDKFIVCLNMVRESKIKIAFFQDIYRASDKKLVVKGKVTGVALNLSGRPYLPQEIEQVLKMEN